MRRSRAAIALALAAVVAVVVSAPLQEAEPETTPAVTESAVPDPHARKSAAQAWRARRHAAFPPRGRVRAARKWIQGRTGASFALIDSRGRLYGWDADRRYVCASVVKAMLLVAYLRQLGGMPEPADQEVLGAMIRWSDNDAADIIHGRVGDPGILDVAQRAHMSDLTVGGHWGGVYFSATDQARFFRRFGRLVPRGARDYARELLASIVSDQRWGFSRVAQREGWTTYFKGGWRRTEYGELVHEAAMFERGGRRFSLAVLTEGSQSHDYGAATLRGVAKRLFQPPEPAAGKAAAAQGPAFARRVTAQPRAAIPPRTSIRAARDFVRRRATSSFAVIDSRGGLHGFAPRRRYVSGSVVKVMLLVAYLRRLEGRMPPARDRALLETMIVLSGNKVASMVHGRVGNAGLWDVARAAGMREFSVGGSWGSALISAVDQARFFRRFDRLTPEGSRAYARELLSSIDVRQRWGFPRPALDTGFEAFFKLGWRGTAAGRLVHAAGMFEREGQRVSLAVLTDGNPSHDYGTATVRGVAERVFGAPAPARAAYAQDEAASPAQDEAGSPAHRRAGLVDVHRFGPGIALDISYAGKDNITGRRLPGYCEEWALMLEPAARDLGRVQRYLLRRNRGLVVLDAYRPARATRALVRWAERTGRGHLVGTYIARRSRHNLGSAVDLTLVRASDGKRLRMGRYDALGPGAHTLDAGGAVLRNRLALKAAMERFGFTNYWREWWHYEHRVTGTVYLDLPLGCNAS